MGYAVLLLAVFRNVLELVMTDEQARAKARTLQGQTLEPFVVQLEVTVSRLVRGEEPTMEELRAAISCAEGLRRGLQIIRKGKS